MALAAGSIVALPGGMLGFTVAEWLKDAVQRPTGVAAFKTTATRATPVGR